jgi:hypothetical protein
MQKQTRKSTKPLPAVPTQKKSMKPAPKKSERTGIQYAQQTPKARRAMEVVKSNPVSGKYLRALIDPATTSATAYPDGNPKASAVIKTKIVRDAYVFGVGNGFEPDGTYFSVLSPTLIQPMLEYQVQNVPPNSTIVAAVSTTDDQTGLFPLTEDVPTLADDSDQMIIPPNTTYNVRTNWGWADQNFSLPMARGVQSSGNVYYGIPNAIFSVAGNTGTVQVSVNLATAVAPGTPLGMTAVYGNAVYAFTSPAIVAGQTQVTFTASANAIVTALDNAGIYSLPGLGFRIFNNTAIPITLSSINIQLNTSIALNTNRFVAISYPDESTFCQLVDQYRTVAMSSWLEYEGSDLMNGGEASSMLYRGGQSPFEIGLYNYSNVSPVPEAYAGCLKYGTYTIWLANSDSDMYFRSLTGHTKWRLPYIINAGLVSQPAQLHSLRYRIDAHQELVSTSQTYSTKRRNPKPESIELASKTLWRYDTSMANGVHLDWIKGVANKASKAAKEMGGWLSDNKSWIVPAATTVAAMI